MSSPLVLLSLLALSAQAEASAAPVPDYSTAPSLERLRAVRFLPPPGDVTTHRFETRGFVAVPMDYARRNESPRLRIFYRLMPARDPKAPILVVVNGGPGAPSRIYRAYEHDYEHPTEQMKQRDALGELLGHFRVLIADQRGTPGYSSALDMGDPGVDPAIVARYFDSAHHALDLQEVIRAVVPEGEPFYMLAQSYGGMIGMRYVTLPEITRLPRGLVLASAVLPHEVVVETWAARRKAQRQLNLQLLAAVPEAKALLGRLRARFGEAGLDPGSVHHLWSLLGKGPAGAWEPALRDRVKSLLQADRRALQEFLDRETVQANPLNYVLSAKELTPGFTDRTLAVVLTRAVPFEDWMIDEQWTLSRMSGGAAWVGPLLDAIDRSPPPLTPAFPPLAQVRERLARLNVLFTLGQGDAYIGEETAHRNASAFAVAGHTSIRQLPGGHKAAFLPAGVEAITAWIAGLGPERQAPARSGAQPSR